MSDNITIGGKTLATKDDGTAHHVKDLMEVADGAGAPAPVSPTNPMHVREPGTYAYRAGNAATTVDVPAQARLKRVSVVAGVSVAATITIGGGETITVPAGMAFDEILPGAAIGADVVIGGTVQAFYVSWTV